MGETFDVIVVGSGVAGALCAWKLLQLGTYRILILEAGDNGITDGQRVEFHHTMDVQHHRGNMFAPYADVASEFVPQPVNAQEELEKQREIEKYYDYTPKSKYAFKAAYNRLVGGSTWSWRGNSPRFIPSDFKLRETYDVGRDWPLDYRELEPWYCDAETELGVSGDHDQLDGLYGAFRSRAFPMPCIPPS